MALGLGANLGDSRAALGAAAERLRDVLDGMTLAPLYRTEPRSPVAQPPFWNTAVVGRTRLRPDELLALAKRLELDAGRRRGERWGPRPLDVDLLLYGDLTSADPALTLPHPRLRERRFVLAPLADLAPRLRVPPDGATVARLLRAVGEPGEPGWVERVDW